MIKHIVTALSGISWVFPSGIEGKFFYQNNAPENLPECAKLHEDTSSLKKYIASQRDKSMYATCNVSTAKWSQGNSAFDLESDVEKPGSFPDWDKKADHNEIVRHYILKPI